MGTNTKQKRLAGARLNHLRQGVSGVNLLYETDLRVLRQGVEHDSFTLEEIGTDQAELEKLRSQNCKSLAREWLRRLRSPGRWSEHYEQGLAILKQGVRDGDFTLGNPDIGTDEGELEWLRAENCKSLVQKKLELLRSKMNTCKGILASLLEEVSKSGQPLETFGTSGESLEKLWSVTVKDEDEGEEEK